MVMAMGYHLEVWGTNLGNTFMWSLMYVDHIVLSSYVDFMYINDIFIHNLNFFFPINIK
jgi:hypothetical protein